MTTADVWQVCLKLMKKQQELAQKYGLPINHTDEYAAGAQDMATAIMQIMHDEECPE